MLKMKCLKTDIVLNKQKNGRCENILSYNLLESKQIVPLQAQKMGSLIKK